MHAPAEVSNLPAQEQIKQVQGRGAKSVCQEMLRMLHVLL